MEELDFIKVLLYKPEEVEEQEQQEQDLMEE